MIQEVLIKIYLITFCISTYSTQFGIVCRETVYLMCEVLVHIIGNCVCNKSKS